MKKILGVILVLLCAAFAEDSRKIPTFAPSSKIEINASITFIDLHENRLYISNDEGEVHVFDAEKRQLLRVISLPQIKDYSGNSIAPRVRFTHTRDNESILIISQENADKSRVSIFKNGALDEVDLGDKAGIISAAYFVDDSTILFSIRSFEIVLFNYKTRKVLWSVRPKFEVFTDLTFANNLALASTEGGTIYKIDLKSGEVLRIFSGANYDYIYSLAAAKNTLLIAGRDKICGIYDLENGEFRRIRTEFMQYKIAISADSTLGAVNFNENSDILVFDTRSQAQRAFLRGGDAPPNRIIFASPSQVIASFGGRSVIFWDFAPAHSKEKK